MPHALSVARAVAIYDRLPLVAEGICALLETCEGIKVVGATTEQDALMELITHRGAEVVVFGGEGLEPEQMVEFAARLDDAGHLAGRQIGLVCVVPGGSEPLPPMRVARAPLFVAAGVSVEGLCDAIAAALRSRDGTVPAAALRAHRAGARVAPARTPITLTLREQEVLRCLSVGLSTREIALRLGITSNTVRTHVQHLMPKLGVHTRLRAAAVATEYLAVSPPASAGDPRPGLPSSDDSEGGE